MPAPAENALELPNTYLAPGRQILANLEINDQCHFTSICAHRCILNVVNQRMGKPLGSDTVLDAAGELIGSPASAFIRHLAIVGKEVFQTPELFLRIVERYHATPAELRPGTIGCITAAANALKHHLPFFVNHPLDWAYISIDPVGVGLRSQSNSESLLKNALELEQAGGVNAIGVNTLLTPDNINDVLKVGKHVDSSGVRFWTVAPFLKPKSGIMRSTASLADIRNAISKIAETFHNSKMTIKFVIDFETLLHLVGEAPRIKEGDRRWRYEYSISSNLAIVAMNPKEGHFLRVRADGELLAKSDFRVVGLERGQYGSYYQGRISQVLDQLSAQISSATGIPQNA